MTGQLRILITGSRTWTDRETIGDELARAIGEYGAHLAEVVDERTGRVGLDWSGVTVVHGGARGADTIAAEIAKSWGCRVERHDPNWSACVEACKPEHRRINDAGQEYCPSAGHRRNRAMVRRGAAVVLAFVRNGSSGATGCATEAAKAGIPVVRHVKWSEVPS